MSKSSAFATSPGFNVGYKKKKTIAFAKGARSAVRWKQTKKQTVKPSEQRVKLRLFFFIVATTNVNGLYDKVNYCH